MTTPTHTIEAFLAALARHDVDAAMALVDSQVAAVLADLVRAFPDLMITVSQVITTGEVVTALFKAEGTQSADYAGAINQEKHLDIDQAWRFVVIDGLITNVDAYWCQAQLYRRLAVKHYDEIAIA
jgi:ketosteroid isomerase-like protein